MRRPLSALLLFGFSAVAGAQDAPLRVTILESDISFPRYSLNKPAYVAVVEASSRGVRVLWPTSGGDEAQLVTSGGREIPITRGVPSSDGVSATVGGVGVSAAPAGGIVRTVPRGWIVVASTDPLAFKDPGDAESKITTAITAAEKKRELSLDDRLSLVASTLLKARAGEVASDRLYSSGNTRTTADGRGTSRNPPAEMDPCDPKRKPQDRPGQVWQRSICGDQPNTEVPKPTPLPTKVPETSLGVPARTPER